MTCPHNISARSFLRSPLQRLSEIVVLLCLLACGASAQTSGTTPSGLSPGAPAGTYRLSGFDNINLYNGNLNFHLPLLGIGGRGGAQMTTTYKHNSVGWTVEREDIEGSGAFYYPNPNWWAGIGSGYGPGALQGRVGVFTPIMAPTLHTTLTRLTFTAPDGTEYELRDELTDGKAYAGSFQGTRTRGTAFKSTDGTAATFISDATIVDPSWDAVDGTLIFPSGYLMLSDGTRYRVDGGTVTWIRDRNGNKLTFAYDAYKRVTTITDSLNRQVTIVYANLSTVFYDQISYKGFSGAQRSIKVWRSSLSQALRAGYTVQTYQQLFPSLNGSDSTVFNPIGKTSAIELPDGRSYQLLYNSYGELARVVLPTGGAVEYDYLDLSSQTKIHRRISERRVYADGTTLESKQVYTATTVNGNTEVVVGQLSAASALLAKSKHYFYGDPLFSLAMTSTSYRPWKEGREYQTESFDTNGTTILRRVAQTWQQRAPVSWYGGSAEAGPANDPRIIDSTTTLVDTNQVAKQTFSFDDSVPYNNQSDAYEYDFGAGAPGALVRRTHTDYITSTAYTGTSVHLRRLPSQTQVFDAAGVEKARATFEYDNYASDGSHAPLTNRSLISGLDSAFNTSYQTRGNLTKTTGWILQTSTQINSYSQYDIAGNLVKAIDPRGYATTFEYADCFGTPSGEARTNIAPTELASQSQSSFAQLTSVTNALGQTAYAQYDYYLGKPVDGEDMNGVVASGFYNDVLDRATQVVRDANNLAAKSQTSFTYDDTNRIVTTKSDFSTFGDYLLRSDALYDGLGRTTETRSYENSTQYITLKQVPFVVLQDPDSGAWVGASQSSNPYRTYLSEQPVWTTAFSDALGRASKVRTPDNAVARTSFSGNTVTVTDQAGKARKSVTDGLGRLTSIYEDPSGLNYQTSYGYDVLGNMLTVSQGVQTRTFVYDSLKRLTSAANPESGTVSHTYDANGNVLTKTDARSITTTIAYDALNRPTTKSYTDATPAVAYFYDNQGLPAGAPSFSRGSATGRLVAVTYGGTSAGNYSGYDALGRTVRKIQQTDAVNYLVEGVYNVSGAMTSETYPSVPGAGDRRTITSGFDTAGRLSSLSSSATSYAPAAGVSSIAYASHGALASETYGNSLVHAATYNNRLQTSEIKLGTAGAPTSILSLVYNYGTTSNNGNIQSVSYTGGGLSNTQTFSYDSLNRLATAQENGGASWSQTNGYDRYANRWVALPGGAQSIYCNTSNNRITGWSYDASGNLLNDGATNYTYDAESHIKTVNGTTAYKYDGGGQRVRKLVGENIRFVYGIGGELIAEFDGSTGALKKEYVYGGGTVATIEPTAVNGNGTRYATSDHLGSPRVVTNSGGGVVSRHDYMPFGEELFAGTGGRTVGMGFSVADGNRQKFTGYERDSETGLDFAQARYHSSNLGRFTSPDPFGGSMRAGDPQSFNRYAYVGNNPLTYTDPTGLAAEGGSGFLPGANGALGRVKPGEGSISGTDGSNGQHWAMAGGGETAYWEAEDEAEQKRVNPHTRTSGNPADAGVDLALAQLVTDGRNGIVVGADAYSNQNNKFGYDSHYQLADGTLHTIHVLGDKNGNKIVGVYAPKEFSRIKYEGGKDGIVSATNPTTHEVLGFAHVQVNSPAALARNVQTTNSAGSRLLGYVGGPNALSAGNRHVHITYFRSATDRAVARANKPATERRMGDFGSKDAMHLRDFRRLVQR